METGYPCAEVDHGEDGQKHVRTDEEDQETFGPEWDHESRKLGGRLNEP